ncbi:MULTISPECIES: hypothetical protein [Agromyces]|nr:MULTISPECIES: hypothetical protein [Agromyces]
MSAEPSSTTLVGSPVLRQGGGIELERLPRIDDVLAERRRWIRAQRGGI